MEDLNSVNSDESDDISCSYCKRLLREPYAHCVMCPCKVLLCQKCLALGIEFADHQPTHAFVLMTLDFPVLEDGWTAAEELCLLDGIARYGPTDWESVAEHVGSNHSARDCKEHYLNAYIGRVHHSSEYIIHRAICHDPPRFPSSSLLHSAYSGYNAARGEFKFDFDNDAELSISDIDWRLLSEKTIGWEDEDDNLFEELFYGVLYGYRRRLRERRRRHKIINRHGLLQPQKNILWLRRYDDSSLQWGSRTLVDKMATSLSSQVARTLSKFSQHLSSFELDALLESLKREVDLKKYLNNLYEMRINGIVSLREAELFKRMSRRREEFIKDRRKYLSNPLLSWRNILDGKLGKVCHIVTQSRRQAPPLDISKLPGAEKLNAKERELCSVARIVPDSFIEFRNILMAECLKLGGLRLAQARTLIKIDVNKTRKLYDFLIEEGSIYLP